MAPLNRGFFMSILEGCFRMKQKNYQGLFLSMLFIVLSYFFTRDYYSPFFWILLCLLLVLLFLREENRLFAWLMISFFGGHLIVIYLDKFIEGMIVGPFFRVMINQILFIVPILSMCYVIIQFNKRISSFLKKPEPFSISKSLYIVLLLLTIGLIFLFILTEDMNVFLYLISFSLIHAVVQEVTWRGILLTQMINITSRKTAVLLTSIAFSVNTTIFGFAPSIFLLYLTLGLAYGFLTTKYSSILPAIVVHTVVLLFSFFNGWIQLPIL